MAATGQLKLRQANVQSAQNSLLGARRKLQKAEQKAQTTAASAAKFEKEYRELCAHPLIKRVEVQGEQVTIRTNTITIDYRGERYVIGEFKIFFNGSGDVSFLNRHRHVDTWRRAWDHPNVVNTHPTRHSFVVRIAGLLAKRDYKLATELCMKYLTSYRTGEPGISISTWPRL